MKVAFIKLHTDPGDALFRVQHFALHLAVQYQCPVEFVLDAVRMVATPDVQFTRSVEPAPGEPLRKGA